MATPDPLQNPAFRGPGFLEALRDALLGPVKPLDCVQIEVSSCCLSRCSYCPRAIHARTWQGRHMSADVFAALWPVLRKARRAHLQGWGEPLLNPRFFDFQAFAAKAGCATSTTTCGMVMDEQLAARLASCGLDIIAFSLVGTDAASNAARAGAPFERVCANILCLGAAVARQPAETRPEIHLAYLVLPDRLDALLKLPQLMDELDISCTVLSTMDYIADEAQTVNAWLPERDSAGLRTLLAEITAKAQRSGRRIHFSLPDQGSRPGDCRENIARTMFVSASGDISPCVYLNVPEGRKTERTTVFGNCQVKSPWAIWQQPDFLEFRQKMSRNEPDAVCESCPKRYEA